LLFGDISADYEQVWHFFLRLFLSKVVNNFFLSNFSICPHFALYSNSCHCSCISISGFRNSSIYPWIDKSFLLLILLRILSWYNYQSCFCSHDLKSCLRGVFLPTLFACLGDILLLYFFLVFNVYISLMEKFHCFFTFFFESFISFAVICCYHIRYFIDLFS
jgi:hypothetical protein